jgi:hypothetical protein
MCRHSSAICWHTRSVVTKVEERRLCVFWRILRILRSPLYCMLFYFIQLTCETGGGWTRSLLRFHLHVQLIGMPENCFTGCLLCNVSRPLHGLEKLVSGPMKNSSLDHWPFEDETTARFRNVGQWSIEEFFIGPLALEDETYMFSKRGWMVQWRILHWTIDPWTWDLYTFSKRGSIVQWKILHWTIDPWRWDHYTFSKRGSLVQWRIIHWTTDPWRWDVYVFETWINGPMRISSLDHWRLKIRSLHRLATYT